jgi:hypothetical protein
MDRKVEDDPQAICTTICGGLYKGTSPSVRSSIMLRNSTIPFSPFAG